MTASCLQVFARMALSDFLMGRHSCRSLLLLLFYLLMIRIDLEGVCDALAVLASRRFGALDRAYNWITLVAGRLQFSTGTTASLVDQLQ